MKLNSEMREQLATEIFEWLWRKGLWQNSDICIYFNGKCWSNSAKDLDEYCYGEHRYFEYEADPRIYFEYVNSKGNILSMSFEGELYDVINYDWCDELCAILKIEFENLFEKYGLYFELGNAWNLTAYEMGK